MADIMGEDAMRHTIDAYQRDGAAVLRNVVSRDWIARLGEASDQVMAVGAGADINRAGEGRFFAGMFSWLINADYAAFIRESGLAEIAGRLMGCREVRFFHDQLLVKEPGTAKRTPWHQDLPYWPVRGEHILSIWVPMDAATPENGVVTYVKGSHRWNAFYASESWSEKGPPAHQKPAAELGSLPYRDAANGSTLADIVEHSERYEFLAWNVEPGDVIVHHPLAVHGAPGNLSADRRRRALATRWFGDDVRWDDTRPHFMRRHFESQSGFPYPKLRTGDRIDDPLFPVIWPAHYS